MDKFNEYKLKLTDKNKALIESYLKRVNDFVVKNSIEKELYIDIENMVFEKLSKEEKLDQLSITKIIKDVGEPEIIFSDYIISEWTKKEKKKEKTEKNDENDSFHDMLIWNWWIRDNKWAWILWVSKTLAEKSKLPLWIVRVLFFILAWMWWIWVFIYFLLWFIFPIKWVKYEWKTFFWYLRIQLYYFIKDTIINTIRSIRDLILFIFTKWYYFIKISFKFIMKYILPIIRFVFFAWIALFLSWGFLALLILWALYFSNITIDNIDYMSVLPNYFMWWILTWIYSIWVFMIAFFLFSISWKWINKYILSSAFVTLVIAIFFWTSSLFHLIEIYSQSNVLTQSVELALTQNDEKDLLLDVHDIVNYPEYFPFHSYRNSAITLMNSEDKTLKVDIENKFIGNEMVYEKISDSITQPEMVKSGRKIKVENPKMYAKKVPPTALRKEITIFVPKWYSIEFNNYAPYLFYVTNAHVSYKYNMYEWTYYPSCWWRKIWYSDEEEAFVCDLSETEIKEAKKANIKKYIMLNFDEISSIKHKNEHKREYWNWDSIWYVDWSFWNFYWTENDIMNFEFNDMSIEVRASVKVKDDNEKIEISDFKINYVLVRDHIFKPKYYLDITSIKSFLWDKYDDYVENWDVDEDYEVSDYETDY